MRGRKGIQTGSANHGGAALNQLGPSRYQSVDVSEWTRGFAALSPARTKTCRRDGNTRPTTTAETHAGPGDNLLSSKKLLRLQFSCCGRDSLQSLLAAVLYTVRSEPESLKLAVFTSEKIEFGTVAHFIVTINI